MNYKKIREELIESMTPLRIFYGIEGYVKTKNGIEWLNQYGEIIPVLTLSMNSHKIKSKRKKLKAVWIREEIQDLTQMTKSQEDELIELLNQELQKHNNGY